MATINNLIRLSDHYDVDPEELNKRNLLNPTLAADIRVFVDPLLLEKSKYEEFSQAARNSFRAYFEKVISLILLSNHEGDKAWKAAFKMLSFPEFGWTKLGYGGVRGAGSGQATTTSLMKSAQEAIKLGVKEPDLFTALQVFEENIGPDRISDMTCNIISNELVAFNQRIASEIAFPLKPYDLRLKNGNRIVGNLIENPYSETPGPILLVPKDILRDLPVAADWSDVSESMKRNKDLREDLDSYVTNIWKQKTKEQKALTKEHYMRSKESLEELIALIRMLADKPYDFLRDAGGEIFWRDLAHKIAEKEPFKIRDLPADPIERVKTVARQVIEQFRFLIEERRLSSELYTDGKPRNERSAQKLFFCVAYAYCKANDIDVTPEAESDNGPVDFKLSIGFNARYLVEIKLSKNSKLIAGYKKQITKYMAAEESKTAVYLVIDLGDLGLKADKLMTLKNEAQKQSGAPELEFVDGRIKPSASVL